MKHIKEIGRYCNTMSGTNDISALIIEGLWASANQIPLLAHLKIYKRNLCSSALLNENIKTKEIIEKFKERTGMSERSFYALKKSLTENKNNSKEILC